MMIKRTECVTRLNVVADHRRCEWKFEGTKPITILSVLRLISVELDVLRQRSRAAPPDGESQRFESHRQFESAKQFLAAVLESVNSSAKVAQSPRRSAEISLCFCYILFHS